MSQSRSTYTYDLLHTSVIISDEGRDPLTGQGNEGRRFSPKAADLWVSFFHWLQRWHDHNAGSGKQDVRGHRMGTNAEHDLLQDVQL